MLTVEPTVIPDGYRAWYGDDPMECRAECPIVAWWMAIARRLADMEEVP
jgi:hypothetical protein